MYEEAIFDHIVTWNVKIFANILKHGKIKGQVTKK